MSKVVGIDLGTTNSLVAYVKDSVPIVIRDKDGDALVPSVVSVAEDNTIHVGREAQHRLLTDAKRTAYSVKRFMGKGREDVRHEAEHFPFRVAGEAGGVVRIGLGDREFTPPEISAFILRDLKERAEAFFAEQGEFDNEIDRAVITVPAYFNDAQRTATRDAGRIAGLEVLRIINEPTAASLAYGLDKKHSGLIAVYDLGGGTFDISILRVEDGVFQVLSTNGDTHLGGDDIDVLLMDRAMGGHTGPPLHDGVGVPLQHGSVGADRRVGPSAEDVQKLRKAAIQAKLDLSDHEQTTFDGRRMTRADFETLIAPIVERTLGPCRQALADAELEPSQIDEVVLVGGSTRIPLVRRKVEELFGRRPHSELNPDEVVALGAAVQADILAGGSAETQDMLLLDVTPLSLGIEALGGVTAKIIHRNSTIPASATEHFTTGVEGQTSVAIHVVQGEREMAKDCRSLARFDLKGIPAMPAGMPRIEVKFLIDANGILHVSAREQRSGKESEIEVQPSYGLTDDQVEGMLLESFDFAEEDFRQRQVIEARREAATILAAVEKSRKNDAWGKLRSDERDQIAKLE